MDYVRVYNEFLEHFKTSTPEERYLRRYGNISEYLYTENHHITPRKLGGSEDSDNILRLSVEEHYFIHLLRYKAFGSRVDYLAVNFVVNGFRKRRISEFHSRKFLSRIERRKYVFYKNERNSFRKNNSWHGEDGARKISEKMVGKIPVRMPCGKIKRIDKDDERVVSGELSHFIKGTRKSDSFKKKISRVTSGEKNPRFSGLSNDDVYEIVKSKTLELGYLPNFNEVLYSSLKNGINFPKSFNGKYRKSSEHGSTFKEILLKIADETGIFAFKVRTRSENSKSGNCFQDIRNGNRIWL